MSDNELQADLTVAYGKRPTFRGSYRCSFGRNAWQPADWLMLKCPRFDQATATWVQHDDHIANPVPAGASPEELMGKLAPDTYASMVLRQKITGPASLSATMSFDHQMAPLVLITPEYANDTKGRPEYRHHWEIVLYDKGLYVWQHTWKAGQCSWRPAAHCKGAFQPRTRYRLAVELGVHPGGKELAVTCGETAFSFFADALPDAYYVGLTACEGVNRFYDFQVAFNP